MKMAYGHSLQQVLNELCDYPRSAEREYPLTRLLGMFEQAVFIALLK